MRYIITGKNRLMKEREQLSRLMEKVEAEERLQREKENRRYKRYQPHTHLRLERLEAVQLTFQFDQD